MDNLSSILVLGFISIISALFGAILGSLISHHYALKRIEEELNNQQAYEFVSDNFLPLLGSLETLLWNMSMYVIAEEKRIHEENSNILSREEAIAACNDGLGRFKRSLEKLIDSGTHLLIRQFAHNIYAIIVVLFYKLQRQSDFDNEQLISKKWFKDLMELHEVLSKISMPVLIQQYKNAMKRGVKIMHTESKSDDRYQTFLEHLRHEVKIVWKIFGSFLLIHTVFLAFLLRSLENEPIIFYQPSAFFAALLGLLLCIPWLSSHLRSRAYFNLRMAQAKEAEPSGWELLKGIGERFSKGEEVIIEDKKYRIKWLPMVLRTERSLPMIIVFFAIVYLCIFILKAPWWR